MRTLATHALDLTIRALDTLAGIWIDALDRGGKWARMTGDDE